MAQPAQFLATLRARAAYRSARRKLLRGVGHDLDAKTDDADYFAIPRIIWIYWHQGWENAPYLARRCRESWERANPGWTVRALDGRASTEFSGLDLSDEAIAVAHRSDVLRLDLLDRYGGVWVDATCLCQTPLDHWLAAVAYRGFFAFSNPFPDRIVSNWFMAAAPGHPIPGSWRDAALTYWKTHHGRPESYAIHHEIFEQLVRSGAEFRLAWAAVPTLSAVPAHACQHFLRGRIAEEDLMELIRSGGAPVHKLTRKLDLSPAQIDAVLDLIGSG